MSTDLESLLRDHAKEESLLAPAVSAAEARQRVKLFDTSGHSGDASPPPHLTPARPKRRRAAVIGIAAIAVLFVSATAIAGSALLDRDGNPNRVETVGPADASPSSEDGWTELPAFPEGTPAGSLVIGSERGLTVLGGTSDSGDRLDGATYDPAQHAWSHIPDGPFPITSYDSTAVWTDDELIVWHSSGQDAPSAAAAAYDPDTEQWRDIAPSPLPPGQTQVVAWTGDRVILWTANRPTGDDSPTSTTAATYDPQTDTWEMIDAGPTDVNESVGVWTGTDLVLLGWHTNAPNGVFPDSQFNSASAYDPVTEEWRELDPPPFNTETFGLPIAAAWTGTEVIAWNSELRGGVLDPVTRSWHALPDLPGTARECYPQATAVQGMVVSNYCGTVAVFHPDTDTWTEPAPPSSASDVATPVSGIAWREESTRWRAISAGDVVIFWHDSEGPTAPGPSWAYEPLAD